jgi:hypothetical protein
MLEIALDDVIIKVDPVMLFPLALIHLLEFTELHALLTMVIFPEEAID